MGKWKSEINMATLFEEAGKFGKSMIGWLYVFVPLFVFFFAFGFKEVSLGGKTLILPYPSIDSIAAQVLKALQQNLLGTDVHLIVTSPLDAFSALALTAFLLAFIVSLPVLLYKLINFLSPALYADEKRGVLLVLIPSVILFLLGSLFGYYLITPAAIGFLYDYALALGAEPLITTSKLIGFVLGTTIFTGILFLTPVFMVLLTRAGLVPGTFWKDNWRYAAVFFLILSGIITPDGTGVTMAMLSVPLVLLYFVGYKVSG